MPTDPFLIVILVALAAVLVILSVGLGGFGIGGKFNARHGNRMMRWRIIAQAIAIAIVLIFVAVRG